MRTSLRAALPAVERGALRFAERPPRQARSNGGAGTATATATANGVHARTEAVHVHGHAHADARARMEARVLRLVHDLTGPRGVGLDTPLMDAGVDSLAAGLLAARLSRVHLPGAGGAGAPLVPLAPLSHLLIFEVPSHTMCTSRVHTTVCIWHVHITCMSMCTCHVHAHTMRPLILEAPTPRAIATRMLERAATACRMPPTPPPPSTPSTPPPPSATAAGVTLVCAAGRFGGGASAAHGALPALWAACGDAVSDAWPCARGYTQDTHGAATGGGGTGGGVVDGDRLGDAVSSGSFLRGSEGFDASFFGISAAEARTYSLHSA